LVLTSLLKISLPNTQLILPTAESKAILPKAQQCQTGPKSLDLTGANYYHAANPSWVSAIDQDFVFFLFSFY